MYVDDFFGCLFYTRLLVVNYLFFFPSQKSHRINSLITKPLFYLSDHEKKTKLRSFGLN